MSHYKRYPEYRPSGVEWIGDVPYHWRVTQIKNIATTVNGATPESSKQEYWDGDVAWYTPTDIDNEVALELGSPRRYISQAGFDSCAVRLSPPGSVILSTRAPIGSVGITTIASTINQGCRTLLPYQCVPTNFLASILIAARGEMRLRGNGTTFQELSTDALRSMRVPMPPREEAHSIACTLDRETKRIDSLIAKKTRFIELLKEKRQALITHAVTKGLDPNVKMKDSGVEWIGEVPEHWSVGRLGDFCSSITTGPFGTALSSSAYVENGIPVINPSHMNNGVCMPDRCVTVSDETANRLKFWNLTDGDLIVARRGELGRAAIVTSKEVGWICGTGSMRLTPFFEKATTAYLYSVLQSEYARAWLDRESVGSTMPNLNESLIARLPVVTPPTVIEQIRLLKRLSDLEKRLAQLTQKTQHSINLLKERRSAFITAAVTGQIDLREAACAI